VEDGPQACEEVTIEQNAFFRREVVLCAIARAPIKELIKRGFGQWYVDDWPAVSGPIARLIPPEGNSTARNSCCRFVDDLLQQRGRRRRIEKAGAARLKERR